MLEALALLARACGTAGLIGGQMDDLKFEGQPATASDLERIHRTKTGALIVATVEGGGLLGDASEEERDALRGFMVCWQQVMLAWFDLSLPVVAAINGHAIAGGCVLGLMADRIFFYPPVLFVMGLYGFIKGLASGNMAGEG